MNIEFGLNDYDGGMNAVEGLSLGSSLSYAAQIQCSRCQLPLS